MGDYDFDKDLFLSEVSHKKVFRPLYRKRGWECLTVTDMKLQSFGVDAICFDSEDNLIFIDEKTDSYANSYNIVVETINPHTGNTGWINKPQLVDNYQIWYYFEGRKEMVIINFGKFKEWFDSNGSNYRSITTQSGTECNLIPISAIPSDCYSLEKVGTVKSQKH